MRVSSAPVVASAAITALPSSTQARAAASYDHVRTAASSMLASEAGKTSVAVRPEASCAGSSVASS